MRTEGRLLAAVLALATVALPACSSAKAWTAPTWVYAGPDGRLELLNANAGMRFCLITKDNSVCGGYSGNDDIFTSAMLHFKRRADEFKKPEAASPVKFTPATGAAWTWSIQPDGSFRDEKDRVWNLVEFRQFGRTYTE